MTDTRSTIEAHDRTSPRSGLGGPILVHGFATAVAMWCAWFLTHLPGLNLSSQVVGPLLLPVFLAGMLWCGMRVPAGQAWIAGAGAGFLTAALNLLVLGQFLVKAPSSDGVPEPGFEGLQPTAAAIVPGFLAFGGVVGAIGGFVGAKLRREPACSPALWLARFGVVSAIAVVPLLLLGGVVTSTASGMAVPGWPDSYGANMFLFPIALMSHPRVFLEHTHRLFGSLVGLTTLALAVYVFASDRRVFVRVRAAVAFILVCAQGALGGGRVLAVSPWLGALHGVVAQLFFALMVAIATYLSPTYRSLSASQWIDGDRKRRVFVTGALHATILQLVFGAIYRHVGQAKGNLHALWAHAGFSVVVVIMVSIAAFLLRSRQDTQTALSKTLRRLGTGLIVVVAVQFLLGWLAFAVVLMSGHRGPAPLATELETAKPIAAYAVLVGTAHQANGALLLALLTMAAAYIRQMWRLKKADQAGSVPGSRSGPAASLA